MSTITDAHNAKSWVPDLFGTSWARVLDGVALLITANWIWRGLLPDLLAHQENLSAPLSWYRDEIRSLGWRYPDWLDALTNWRITDEASWLRVALLAAAVGFTLSTTTARTPGYRTTATALLLIGAQWFGVETSLKWYTAALFGVFAAALLRAATTEKFDIGTSDNSPYHYSYPIVVERMTKAVLGVLVLPVIAPFAFVAYSVRAFGFDNSLMHDSPENRALTRCLERAMSSNCTVDEMSAQDFGLLLSSIALVSRSDEDARRVASINVSARTNANPVHGGGLY